MDLWGWCRKLSPSFTPSYSLPEMAGDMKILSEPCLGPVEDLGRSWRPIQSLQVVSPFRVWLRHVYTIGWDYYSQYVENNPNVPNISKPPSSLRLSPFLVDEIFHVSCFNEHLTDPLDLLDTKTTFRGCTGQLRNMVNVFPLPVWPQRGWGGMLPYVALPPT